MQSFIAVVQSRRAAWASAVLRVRAHERRDDEKLIVPAIISRCLHGSDTRRALSEPEASGVTWLLSTSKQRRRQKTESAYAHIIRVKCHVIFDTQRHTSRDACSCALRGFSLTCERATFVTRCHENIQRHYVRLNRPHIAPSCFVSSHLMVLVNTGLEGTRKMTKWSAQC